MSAIDTALRVIEWAMTAGTAVKAPPQGDVRLIEQLAHPPASLCKALGQLTALTAARMRLGTPPLGDDGAVGLGGLVMAAAIGAAGIPPLARIVLKAVPQQESPVEWVTRHGLVGPALRYLDEDMADDCRLLSPLTALLDRPAKGQDARAMAVAAQMLDNPHGHLALTLHLAQPTQDIKVRQWRYTLLERYRLGTQQEKDFVLDVYEALLVHHQQEAMDQVKAARAVIGDPAASGNEERLRDALSVGTWWGPLGAIERTDIDALRARPYLVYEYRQGIALFKLSQKLTGGLS